MHIFSYLENRFELFGLWSKTLLYALPLLSVLGFYSFTLGKKNNHVMDVVPLINHYNMKEKIVDILKAIEAFSLDNEINLLMLSNTHAEIKIHASAAKQKQIKFLHFLENYNAFSKIKNVSLDKSLLEVEVVFSQFYIKEYKQMSQKIEKLFSLKRRVYYVNALVGKSACINEQWYTINDEIDEFTLVNIDKDSIYLKSPYQTLQLKVNQDETY